MLEKFKDFFNFIKNEIKETYSECKQIIVVLIISIIQIITLLVLLIHSYIFEKTINKQDNYYKFTGIGQNENNPMKINRKSFMVFVLSILSCIFHYLTIDLLCQNNNSNIAWLFSFIIFINFITSYLYYLFVLVIFLTMIFFIFKINDGNDEIKHAARLAGGSGLLLFVTKMISILFDIFNSRIKDKKVNKFWQQFNKLISKGECENDGDCKANYGDDSVCNTNYNLCEWSTTNDNTNADIESQRLMELLGISDDSTPKYIHDDDHSHGYALEDHQH